MYGGLRAAIMLLLCTVAGRDAHTGISDADAAVQL